jgi:ComEC/Rec2-related protein
MWLVVAIILFLVSLGFSRVFFFSIIVISGLLVGVFRVNIALVSQAELAPFIGETVEVTGVIYEDLDERNGNMVVRLNHVRVNGGEPIEADIYAILSGVDSDGSGGGVLQDEFSVKRGDTITVHGKLSDGFGAFSATMYRARITDIVTPIPGDFTRQLRDSFAEKTSEYVKSPESSLAFGYLLGQKAALPNPLMDALLVVGLTHMVVASGSALSILVGAMRGIFKKVSRASVVIFGVILIILFAAMTGFGASIIRAAIISIIGLVFWYFGRKSHPIFILSFAAAFTLILSPAYISNLGWLLSFAAFAGIIIFCPLLIRYLYGHAKPNFLALSLLVTLSASIFTLPLLLYFTGHFSIASIPANILLGPTLPIVMLTTFLTGIFAFVAPPLSALFGFISEKILEFHILLVHFFENLTFLHYEVRISAIATIISYIAIILLVIFLKWKTKFNFREVDLLDFTPQREQSQYQHESNRATLP